MTWQLVYTKQAAKDAAKKSASNQIKVGAKLKATKNSKAYANSKKSASGKLAVSSRVKAKSNMMVRVKGKHVVINPRLLKDAKGRPLKGKALIAAKRRAFNTTSAA